MARADAGWSAPPARLALHAHQVHVWRAALDRPPEETRALARLLAAEERERAASFRFARDRDRYVVGRATLRLILARYTGCDPAGLVFRLGPHGKPALERTAGAEGTEAPHFNVAHADGLALYAVARGRRVGVDLERMRPIADAEQIAARFFAPRECAALAAMAPDARLRPFFACWTRKEAYVKATGDGLSRPLDGFAVTLAPGEPAALLDVADDPAEVERWRLAALAPARGYIGALAVEGSGWRLARWRLAGGLDALAETGAADTSVRLSHEC